MMGYKFWIFLHGLGFLLVYNLQLACGRTLVKPPWAEPPKPPKPGTRLLQNSTMIPFGTPTCTTNDQIGGPIGTTRNGVTNTNLRWSSTFYVLPDTSFEQWEKDVINHAMWNLWQVIPCVRFGIYPSGSQPSGDYMRLIKGTNNGCNSYVGRQGGRQDINLQSPGCMNVGTVMHELLHALGFYHEQCRHDRDDYIWIYWDNIVPDTTTYSVPYDHNSIMHYDSWAFSKNGMSTMLAKNGQHIGSTGILQESDKQKLKMMYNC